jgi:DNA segregation ATPase FtsK/SpoIIIE-like protein
VPGSGYAEDRPSPTSSAASRRSSPDLEPDPAPSGSSPTRREPTGSRSGSSTRTLMHAPSRGPILRQRSVRKRPSVNAPVPLGPFEDARPVSVLLAHRHALVGGVSGSGKSGLVNAILATLVACPDVVLWGIDLKGGMEFGPWARCLGRLATTPNEAAQLLGEAVAILETRAAQLARDGVRLWLPTPDAPALVIVIDEYAELSEQASAAIAHADSIARRGRAVAVTLLVATQRPTQKAMGEGSVRSQTDVRLCLRVRERRDVDLVLDRGMLAAGWHAHLLDAPGKFLVSSPEHNTPRRARSYLVSDDAVQIIANRWATERPTLDTASQQAADDYAEGRHRTALAVPSPRRSPEDTAGTPEAVSEADAALWAALSLAPDNGVTVPQLMKSVGMSRPWIYRRLATLTRAGEVKQITRGRWRATDSDGQDSGTH